MAKLCAVIGLSISIACIWVGSEENIIFLSFLGGTVGGIGAWEAGNRDSKNK